MSNCTNDIIKGSSPDFVTNDGQDQDEFLETKFAAQDSPIKKNDKWVNPQFVKDFDRQQDLNESKDT